MKYSQWEKYEIIRLVEASSLSVRRTLEQIGVSRSSFYEWYRRYAECGVEALADHTRCPNKFWNRIPDSERQAIIEHALEHPELSLDASDVHTCALFSKDSGSELAQPDYVGIAGLPALWLVGYGLDAQGNYRGLPHLYAVPKAEGVPRCLADGLFASDGPINMELYHGIRKKILSDMISAQLD